MTLLDSVTNVLKQYTSGSTPDAANAAEHFDQVAQTASPNALAEGLSAMFKSDQTPAFGNMVGSLFGQSNGEQKAGMLNQLIAAVGPSTVAQMAGGGALASLLGGGASQVTPQQAQNISPEVVQQIATHAEKTDPSIVDRASAFYAEHSTLVKTLGGAWVTHLEGGATASGHRNGHRHHVIDEECRGHHQSRTGTKVRRSHFVGSATAGVGLHHLAARGLAAPDRGLNAFDAGFFDLERGRILGGRRILGHEAREVLAQGSVAQ